MDLLALVPTVPDFPKPGVAFKDLTPLLEDPARRAAVAERLAAPFAADGVTHVLAVEARGFWFGVLLADRLGAAFVPVRKPGKLPRATLRETYALEYGEDCVEIHADALPPGARVLVHDDVIATGGTAAAAVRLARRAGSEVVGCAFVLELGFLNGRAALPEGVRIEAALAV